MLFTPQQESTMPDPNSKFPTDNSSRFSPWEGSSVSVRQGRHWSSALIWLTSGLFSVSLLWAFTSKNRSNY